MTIPPFSTADVKVLAAVRPGEDPFRVFDGLPDRAVVRRIAGETRLDETDVYYSLKFLRLQGRVPKPPLQPVLDLLAHQIQMAVARLRADSPLALFDENGEPCPGAVLLVQQHCSFPFQAVQRRLAELRAGVDDFDCPELESPELDESTEKNQLVETFRLARLKLMRAHPTISGDLE